MFFVTIKHAFYSHVFTTTHHAKTIEKPRSSPVEIHKPLEKQATSPQTRKILPSMKKTLTLGHPDFGLKEAAKVLRGEQA